MSFINYASREINCKIVYYGPGLCGKTTNLQYVYQKTAPDAKGKMISLATETERTLFFDFLPLNRWEFQPGIGVSLRKQVLKRLGIFSTAKVRHPGPDADPRTLAQLFRIVEHLRGKGYALAM